MPLRVLICDERPLVGPAVERLLRAEPGLEVTRCAATRREALTAVRDDRPDVVLLGPRPGGEIGADLVRELRESAGAPAVVAYTTDAEIDDVLRAGADGVVAASAGRDELVRAIRAVGAGQAALGAAATRRLVDWYRARQDERPDAGLTPREREILGLTTAGLSVPEIAERLHIDRTTVRTHLHHLRRKRQSPCPA